jgi:hypothetical protein
MNHIFKTRRNRKLFNIDNLSKGLSYKDVYTCNPQPDKDTIESWVERDKKRNLYSTEDRINEMSNMLSVERKPKLGNVLTGTKALSSKLKMFRQRIQKKKSNA